MRLFVASTSPLTATRTVMSGRWRAQKVARWCCSRRSSESGSGLSTRQVPRAVTVTSLSRKALFALWVPSGIGPYVLKPSHSGVQPGCASDVTSWLLTQPEGSVLRDSWLDHENYG